MLFLKPPTSMLPTRKALIAPHDEMHHEVEVGIIFNKQINAYIPPEKAAAYIGGMCAAMDFTERNAQAMEKEKGWPWMMGKCKK